MLNRALALALCAAMFAATGGTRRRATRGTPHDFDFLLGTWRYTAVAKTSRGDVHYTGTWRGYRILEGAAIADEFQALGDSGRVLYGGLTIRTFDDSTGTWTIRYLDEAGGHLGTWREGQGARVDEGMRLEQVGRANDGRPALMRIHYSDIATDHFLWRDSLSTDGGRTWIFPAHILHVTRAATP